MLPVAAAAATDASAMTTTSTAAPSSPAAGASRPQRTTADPRVSPLAGCPAQYAEPLCAWLIYQTDADTPSPRFDRNSTLVEETQLRHVIDLVSVDEAALFVLATRMLVSPKLLHTEHTGVGWRVGSGWFFPPHALEAPRRRSRRERGDAVVSLLAIFTGRSDGVTGLRFAVYDSGEGANLVLAAKESEHCVNFARLTERDGDVNVVACGRIDTRTTTRDGAPSETAAAAASAAFLTRRYCPHCSVRRRRCKCDRRSIAKFFRQEMSARRVRQGASGGATVGAFGPEYLRSWLQGTWGVERHSGAPLLAFCMRLHRSGFVLESAIRHVMQSEILRSLSPLHARRFLRGRHDAAVLLTTASTSCRGVGAAEKRGGAAGERRACNGGAESYLMLKPSALHPQLNLPLVEMCESPPSMRSSLSRGVSGGEMSQVTPRLEFSVPTSLEGSRGGHGGGYAQDECKGGDAKYECAECGLHFRRKYDVTRHVNGVHRKDRSYHCGHCGRTFLQRGHMNEHIRATHALNNAITCGMCGKHFGVRSKLMRHIAAVHENIREFMCEVCGKSYREKSYLKKHVRLKHGLGDIM